MILGKFRKEADEILTGFNLIPRLWSSVKNQQLLALLSITVFSIPLREILFSISLLHVSFICQHYYQCKSCCYL